MVAVSAFIHEHDLSLFTSSTLILPFLPMNVIQPPSKSSVVPATVLFYLNFLISQIIFITLLDLVHEVLVID